MVVAFVLTILALVGSAAALPGHDATSASAADDARLWCTGVDLPASGPVVTQNVPTMVTAEVTPSENAESVEWAGDEADAPSIASRTFSVAPHASLRVQPTCEGSVPVLRFRLRAFPSRGPPLA